MFTYSQDPLMITVSAFDVRFCDAGDWDILVFLIQLL